MSAPVPVPFLWTLNFLGTWIWDLDLGLGFGTGLGLDNFRFNQYEKNTFTRLNIEDFFRLIMIYFFKSFIL